MLKQLSAPNHVIAFTIDGALSAEGIQEYRSIFDEKRQQYEQIGLYVEFLELADINASTLLEGVKADIELWRHLDQLSRCAVVSDKKWPQTLVSIIKRIVPKLEMQVFPSSQSVEALQWAATIPKNQQPSALLFTFCQPTRPMYWLLRLTVQCLQTRCLR